MEARTGAWGLQSGRPAPARARHDYLQSFPFPRHQKNNDSQSAKRAAKLNASGRATFLLRGSSRGERRNNTLTYEPQLWAGDNALASRGKHDFHGLPSS
jgi:hypothetical protein